LGFKLLVLAVLILINAFFAGIEVAFLSVNINKIKQKADEGDSKAILLRKMIENPSKFLATIQVGISFAGLFSGAFAGQAFSEPIVAALIAMGVTASPEVLTQFTILALTILLSYFSLVFGELVPKRVAMKNAYALSMTCVGFVNGVSTVATPFVKLLSLSTNMMLKLFGIDPHAHDDNVTEEEIRLMVDVGGTSGSIDESEKEMINNVFEFDNKSAEDIATHRKDMLALPIDVSREAVIKSVTQEHYSRIPVYEDNIDNIVGILHIKDFFNYILKPENMHSDTLNIKEILRKPYFVPESKKTDELFEEMQKNKVHIAIVVDEYGGTAGIVTMEDLIEEIMGSILDEYDEEEQPEIEEIDQNTYLINGRADLDTVSEFFNVSLPIDDYDTISGFIIGQIGRIPLEEEQPEIEFNGLLFKVHSVEEKRISSVVAVRP
jgi:putative hemolysin